MIEIDPRLSEIAQAESFGYRRGIEQGHREALRWSAGFVSLAGLLGFAIGWFLAA